MLDYADGSNDPLKSKLVEHAEIVFCAGRAGVQVLSSEHLSHAKRLKVAADVNAVPPAGIEGMDAQDNGKEIAGTPGVGIGALAVGNIKYQVESGLFRMMIEADKPQFLDFRQAFALARDLVA